jgi:hypothetical protein
MSTTMAALAFLVSATANNSAANTQYKRRMTGPTAFGTYHYVTRSACKADTGSMLKVRIDSSLALLAMTSL